MNTTRLTVLILCVSLTMATAALGRGLVAHYSFEDEAGSTVRDCSGQGNEGVIQGGAERVRGAYGTALALDGNDDFVGCGTRASLDIAKRGTISVWCRPSTLQGGLVNWSTGGGWTDERLVLAFNTYRGGQRSDRLFRQRQGTPGVRRVRRPRSRAVDAPGLRVRWS